MYIVSSGCCLPHMKGLLIYEQVFHYYQNDSTGKRTHACTILSKRIFRSIGSNALTYLTLHTLKLTRRGLTRWRREPRGRTNSSACPALCILLPSIPEREAGAPARELPELFFTQFGSCICKTQLFIAILKLLRFNYLQLA